MAVAVFSVLLVQMSFDNVISVFTMRNGIVSTRTSMLVAFFMSGALMRFTRRGSFLFQLMLIYMIVVNMVQMPIMQVISMPLVCDRFMATILPVLVRVLLMNITGHRTLL